MHGIVLCKKAHIKLKACKSLELRRILLGYHGRCLLLKCKFIYIEGSVLVENDSCCSNYVEFMESHASKTGIVVLYERVSKVDQTLVDKTRMCF